MSVSNGVKLHIPQCTALHLIFHFPCDEIQPYLTYLKRHPKQNCIKNTKLHYVVSKYSIWNVSQHACTGYKANTCDRAHRNSHTFFQPFRNWHKRCTKRPFSMWQKTRPCDYCTSGTETPQCLWHTHTRAVRTVSLSAWSSVKRRAQLFTQTFQRRSQHWCKDAKSYLNRMQETTCIIGSSK